MTRCLSKSIRLSFVVAFICLGGFGQAALAADVGKVLLGAGDTIAVRAGQTVKLTLGSTIQDGDVLRTGPASNLQVRFIDESIISMKESSELRIREFKYSGRVDGTERAFFDLVKGGLRTVTGLVGSKDHKNYAITTPVATLGVRGTDYSATICQGDCRNADGTLAKDGLYGRVLGLSHGSNRIDVTNGSDTRTFGINENYYVADAQSPVQRLQTLPEFATNRLEGRRQGGTQAAAAAAGADGAAGGETQAAAPGGGSGTEQASSGGAAAESRTIAAPEPLPQIQYVATQNLSPEGRPVVVLPTPDGWVLIYPLTTGMEKAFFDGEEDPAVFNASNHLVSFGAAGASPSGRLNGGTVVDPGSLTLPNGQVLSWGRWTGTTAVITNNGVTLSGVPVLFATATNVQNDDSSVAFGGVATYNFAGGPKPVDFAGNAGSVTGGSLTINFTNRTADFAMSVTFQNIGTFGPANFSVNGAGSHHFGDHTGDVGGILTGTCTGGGCATAAVSGGFSLGTTGPDDFGLAVVVGSFGATQAGGVAFLNLYRSATFTPGPAPTFLTGQIAWARPSTPLPLGQTSGIATDMSSFDTSNNLVNFSSPNQCVTGTCTLRGAVGAGSIVDTGSSGLVDGSTMYWGRWDGGEITDRISGTQTTYTPATGVPFVLGSANTAVPTSGSFTYTFAGGPMVTNTAGATGHIGGGAFQVNFGATQSISVATQLTFSIGGASFALSSACGGSCTFGGPSTFMNMTLNGSCTGGACATSAPITSNATGLLVGPQAGGLTVAGNITSPAPMVTFAGAFQR